MTGCSNLYTERHSGKKMLVDSWRFCLRLERLAFPKWALHPLLSYFLSSFFCFLNSIFKVSELHNAHKKLKMSILVHPSICVCLSMYLSLSLYMSVYLRMYVCLSLDLSIYIIYGMYHSSLYPSICPFIPTSIPVHTVPMLMCCHWANVKHLLELPTSIKSAAAL